MFENENLINLIITNALTIGAVVFILVTFYMWKVDEVYNKYKPSFLKEWCIHCMSFWFSLLLGVIYAIVSKEYFYLCIPLTSTPFSVLLYNSIMN